MFLKMLDKSNDLVFVNLDRVDSIELDFEIKKDKSMVYYFDFYIANDADTISSTTFLSEEEAVSWLHDNLKKLNKM